MKGISVRYVEIFLIATEVKYYQRGQQLEGKETQETWVFVSLVSLPTEARHFDLSESEFFHL